LDEVLTTRLVILSAVLSHTSPPTTVDETVVPDRLSILVVIAGLTFPDFANIIVFDLEYSFASRYPIYSLLAVALDADTPADDP
jgi:hypothetical protein